MAGPSHLVHDRATLLSEQEQAKLLKLAATIIAFGIPKSVFNRDAIINNGFTYKKFLKLVKFVSSFNDFETMLEAISLGLKNKFFIVPDCCDVKSFVCFASFLKSKEGRDALHGFRREKCVLARLRDGEEDVLLATFHAQRQEYLSVMEAARAPYDKEIARCRAEIKRLEELIKISEAL
ncbi:hypothetical protein Tco_0040255 [Tanacetum coccineum]